MFCHHAALYTIKKDLVNLVARARDPLWEESWDAEENQPFIGCLIISLTHSLLIEICAILIIQKS